MKIMSASTKAIWLFLFIALPNVSWSAVPQPCLSAKFDDIFIEATADYRRDFNKPEWTKAQTCQESHFKVDAVSPVGARSLLQVMPKTYDDVVKNLHWDSNVSAFDPERAIRAGVYYQGAQFRIFNPKGRTPEDRNRLALASYNAGAGSVIKAQAKCDNAILWDNISRCLYQITGKFAQQTLQYVENITAYAKVLRVRP